MSDISSLKRPFGVRFIHWSVAILMGLAIGTGYAAFDFSSTQGLLNRTVYFSIHRLAGMVAAILALIWLWMRWAALRKARRDGIASVSIVLFHLMLGSLAFVIPVLPWLARMMDGRFEEAFSLWPHYNLVSKSDWTLAYFLFDWHKILVKVFFVMLGIHVGAVLLHHILGQHHVLGAMLWRSSRERVNDGTGKTAGFKGDNNT